MLELQPLHTFGFTAKANRIININTIDDINQLGALDEPWWILGEGSNTVFTDDFHGTIIKNNLTGITRTSSENCDLLSVAAGENWHQLVCWCLDYHLYGLENLALIPGTVGAAPIQNIGAYGREVATFIQSVDYIELATGIAKNISQADCAFGYRDSIFKHALSGKVLITAVNFSLPKKWLVEQSYGELTTLDNPTAQDIFNKVVEVRQAKLPDPAQLGNAGSFFKNPVVSNELLNQIRQKWAAIPAYPISATQSKVPAAWLIDQLGYKGKECGGIICHPSQPLVLANTGNGTGKALLQLARQIKQDVLETFGIELENEVRLLMATGVIEL